MSLCLSRDDFGSNLRVWSSADSNTLCFTVSTDCLVLKLKNPTLYICSIGMFQLCKYFSTVGIYSSLFGVSSVEDNLDIDLNRDAVKGKEDNKGNILGPISKAVEFGLRSATRRGVYSRD